MTKWYVTADKHSSHLDDPDERVWTLSRNQSTTGWNTDSGHPGYGLTKADAEELANAANEVERMQSVLHEWDGLIQHQYSGSQEAMSDMVYAAQATAFLLHGNDGPWPKTRVEVLEEENDRLRTALQAIAQCPIPLRIPGRGELWSLAVQMQETAIAALKEGEKTK
jgi:hypothetical protein